VQWQPPVAASARPMATSPAQVCLNLEPGRSAGSYGNSSLTPDLKGRLLLYGPLEGHTGYVISTVKVDGSDRVYVGQGTWPSFSPDGSKVAYSGPDGLYVHDLAAGTDVRLPGTNENDYHPLWSPAGDRIAFVRGAGAFDLFVIGADGSGLKRITTTPEYEELAGWLPDGKRVVYSAVVGGVTSIRSVDVDTGESHELFQLEGRVKSVGAAPSPDGQSIVYTDVLFGNPSGGLYMARLDGSERRLIAALGMGGLSAPVWSPDGEWLAARLPDSNDPVPVPVLIQPGTCTVIVLNQLRGEVEGWGP
jgi:TolB protein